MKVVTQLAQIMPAKAPRDILARDTQGFDQQDNGASPIHTLTHQDVRCMEYSQVDQLSRRSAFASLARRSLEACLHHPFRPNSLFSKWERQSGPCFDIVMQLFPLLERPLFLPRSSAPLL